MTTHLLKCWPSLFRAMKDGHKKVDIRKWDRDFAVGDYLIQMEFDAAERMVSGEVIVLQVTHILSGAFGLGEGYVAMSVTELTTAEDTRVLQAFFDTKRVDDAVPFGNGELMALTWLRGKLVEKGRLRP